MTRPLRIAIVGAGPAGFYTAAGLFALDRSVEVDLFDRLPLPYGLVRFGVAPDHQNIKAVIRALDKTAKHPGFRFFGDVELGRDLTADDLATHYDQWVLTVGCGDDARLGVEGEDLPRSYGARSFVAWYNGHPDHRDDVYDLDVDRAVVVGVGNVALDVARVLIRDRDELAATDIAPHALDALRRSRIREVVILGRRGPVQAAFTHKEIADLGKLKGVDIFVDPADMELDPGSEMELQGRDDPGAARIIDTLREFAAREPTGAPRSLRLVFRASPTRIVGASAVEGIDVERNRLDTRDGRVVAIGMGEVANLSVGAVFRSIGYRGHPVPGVPFDPKAGRIPNNAGRITDTTGGAVRPGAYVAGWAKRGPSGVIGTNRSDALDTVARMVEDHDNIDVSVVRDAEAVPRLLAARGVAYTTWADWARLDAIEVARGAARGAVREKVTSWAELRTLMGDRGVGEGGI